MRLPDGYVEVQYIQSTGTQYINTDFTPDSNTRVVCDFAYTSNPTAAVFMSRPKSNNSNMFGIFNISGTLRSDYGSEKTSFPSDLSPLNRMIYDKNKNICKIGDATVTNTTRTFSSVYELFLFASDDGGSASYFASGQLYSCQIYDDDTLIRDFTPCINPDGQVGLYDSVNSKFYGNAGTGVFFAGPPKVSLPSRYTQLEYILSHSTEHIDTEINPGDATKVEIDFEPTTLAASHQMIFGSRNTSSGGNQFIIGWTGHKSPAVWRSDYGSSQVNFTTTVAGVGRHYAVKNAASCKIDDSEVTNTAAAFTSSYSMYLFGGNQGGTAVSQITSKLYGCKIYTSDQLVRDFIPCINPAGAVGLYDLVNSKFYANAGTGTFDAGPEVTWPSNDAIYVKVNGIWKQIDGIKLL